MSVGGVSGIGGIGGVNAVYPVTPVSATKNSEARAALPEEKSNENTEEVKQKKRLGVIECETCENRTYQDGSDDPGVSFKSPTKLTPNEAASAVPSHEREHFNRETAKAAEEDREVLSNSIKIFTSVCPECGRTYVSGGLTTTVTRAKDRPEEGAWLKKLMGGDDSEKDPNSVFNVSLRIANRAYGLNYDTKR